MSEIYASPLFGIVLCIFSFEIGLWINRKTVLRLQIRF